MPQCCMYSLKSGVYSLLVCVCAVLGFLVHHALLAEHCSVYMPVSCVSSKCHFHNSIYDIQMKLCSGLLSQR